MSPGPLCSGVLGLDLAHRCGFMLVEPARVTKVFERRHKLYHLIPAMVTVLALLALSILHMPSEPPWAKMVRDSPRLQTCSPADSRLQVRAMGFSMLAISWVYIVGTQKMHGPYTEASSHFIARFAPVSHVVHALLGRPS